MSTSFASQFAFQPPAVVNFVGGGGKTSLILRLLGELSRSRPAIYTTTTRIHPPEPVEGMILLAGSQMSLLQTIANRLGRSGDPLLRQLVVTRTSKRLDLLPGVEPDFSSGLELDNFPFLLNEADGARSMSLKMPREGEPVLIERANYLVPVIGLDCLFNPLGPKTLFRFEMAADRFSLEEGRLITPELASSLLLHPQGVCKDWHAGVAIIPYINKVDTPAQEAPAAELAQAILENGNFPINKVVWGSLLNDRAATFPAQTD